MTRIEIEIPEEVSASMDHLELTVEGEAGSVTRRLWYPGVDVSVADGTVVIEAEEEDAQTNATVGTFRSHVNNMFHGASEGWTYRMTVNYAHFPMQVELDGDEVVINNFLGERAPRRTAVRGNTEVEIDGEDITLTGPNKEDVGQTAAAIEQLTSVSDKDTRVFQDGVYITEKPSKGGA